MSQNNVKKKEIVDNIVNCLAEQLTFSEETVLLLKTNLPKVGTKTLLALSNEVEKLKGV